MNFPVKILWSNCAAVCERGQDIYLIQSHSRPVHRNIMEMLIAIDCLERDSAGPDCSSGTVLWPMPKATKRISPVCRLRPVCCRI
ncbi:MAG: ribose-phosphate pyrophosphokinase-like domain-containing protein [Chloroflexi bacterium]|nr:ribose-phosphate pyrophosphokinase-like domain-containing protein [Chloroflexota bacterium]